MTLKYFGILTSFMFVAGCATVDDFKKMTLSERAQYVCSRDKEYKQHYISESIYKSKIDDTSMALQRGYRIHKSCKVKAVAVPGNISCLSNLVGPFINTDCTQQSNIKNETVCTETPVSIDANLESRNLVAYKNSVSQAEAEKWSAFRSCGKIVIQLSAEQAFQYFKDNK